MKLRTADERGWRRIDRKAGCGLAALVVLFGVHESSLGGDGNLDQTNPYAIISARNAFRLAAPPPVAELDKTAPPALPPIRLGGFMRIGDQVKAFLAVKVRNPDPKGSPFDSYLTLAEGDKDQVGSGENQFEVQLVRIHADQDRVDLMNSGTLVTLSMKDNGYESTGSNVVTGPRTLMAGSAPLVPIKPPALARRGGAAPDGGKRIASSTSTGGLHAANHGLVKVVGAMPSN